MLRRIRPKPLLALDGLIDLLRRDHPLFHKPVRDDRSHRAVEEVQYPVVNASQADAQFVNSVAHEVRFRPTLFVAQLAQFPLILETPLAECQMENEMAKGREALALHQHPPHLVVSD